MIDTQLKNVQIIPYVYKNMEKSFSFTKNKNEQINNCTIFVFEIDSGKILFSNDNPIKDYRKSDLMILSNIFSSFLLPGGKKLYELDQKTVCSFSEDKIIENIYRIETKHKKNKWICCRCKAFRKKKDGTAAQLLCSMTDVSSFKERGMDPLRTK